jgi:predicted transcriptional regulator
MTDAAEALALFFEAYPTLPREVAPVYFLLCDDEFLTAPTIARRLGLAQSTTLRSLALLLEAGLVERIDQGSKLPRWGRRTSLIIDSRP